MGRWDVEQFSHEMGGRNIEAWDKLCSTSDATGDLQTEIFKVLAKPELLEEHRSCEMYVSISSSAAMPAINTYFRSDHMSNDAIDLILEDHGRGSEAWKCAMEHLQNVTTVFRAVLSKNSNAIQNISTLIDLIDVRVSKLAPKPASAEGSDYEPWAYGLNRGHKQICCELASVLQEKVDELSSMKKAITRAARASAKEEIQRREEKEAERKSLMARARSGRVELDDPAHE